MTVENTRDLADFNTAQLEMAGKLLSALRSDRDRTQRIGDRIAIELNPVSGFVFIVDVSTFAVAMLRDGLLLDWLVCSCGYEGFSDQLEASANDCCQALVRREIRKVA